MSPPASPIRRVLGNRDPNASLNITSPRNSVKAGFDNSTKSPARVQVNVYLEKSTSFVPASHAGRKRPIAEVEDPNISDWNKPSRRSQATEISTGDLYDQNRENNSMTDSMTATTGSQSMGTNMTSFSFNASQEIQSQNAMEQHFEIVGDDISQNTLEKIHAVPLPQNNSQPAELLEELRPLAVTRGSQDSVGMSVFVDFGGSEASQRSDGLEMIDVHKETEGTMDTSVPAGTQTISTGREAAETLSDEEYHRRSMLDEKAEQLRTRLQLAYFKVRTNQTTRPFSRLRVPEELRKSPTPPPLLPVAISLVTAPGSGPTSHQRGGINPESHVSAMRARATAQHKPPARNLNTLPIPTIKPTTFSARYADERISHAHPSVNPRGGEITSIPSSPPVSRLSAEAEDDTEQNNDQQSQLPLPPKTPATTHTTNEQLSSPPLSQNGDHFEDEDENDDDSTRARAKPSKSGKLSSRTEGRRGLTSSVVKGEAADGLLQLMRSGSSDQGLGLGGPRAGGKGWCGV